jgi:hypothetical protein
MGNPGNRRLRRGMGRRGINRQSVLIRRRVALVAELSWRDLAFAPAGRRMLGGWLGAAQAIGGRCRRLVPGEAASMPDRDRLGRSLTRPGRRQRVGGKGENGDPTGDPGKRLHSDLTVCGGRVRDKIRRIARLCGGIRPRDSCGAGRARDGGASALALWPGRHCRYL